MKRKRKRKSLGNKNRFQRFLFLSLFFFSAFITYAQVNVRGKVTDTKGETLIGVNVTVKGTTQGTVTDYEGMFSLQSPNRNSVLEFSYVGFKTIEIPLNGQTFLNVEMSEETELLEEVVVVGYGTQKKETLTGSVSSITNKELNTTTTSSLAQNLQGKVAGFQVRQNSGEPGDFNTTINIRGFGEPLYVIDGVPSELGSNEFQRLNPNDIESISILKDASAAIYGRRAGNGVVIVTTRKGDPSKTRFNYNVVYGIQQPTDMPVMANRSQLAQLRNEAEINASIITNSAFTPFYTEEQLAYEMSAPSTDWYGLVMRDFATQAQHNLSASGGNDRTSYFISLGYLKEDGILKSKDLNYEKYSFRTNLKTQLTKRFSTEVNLSGRLDTKNSPSAGYWNIFYATRTALPSSPVYANDNPDYLAYQSFLHPLALADKDISGFSENKNKIFNGSLSLTYDVPYIEGLLIKGVGSYSFNSLSNKLLSKEYKIYTYDPSKDIPYIPTKKNSPSSISNDFSNLDMFTLQAFADYSRTFAEKHNLNATFGYEYSSFFGRWAGLARQYTFYTTDQINQASVNNQTNSGIEEERANLSLIGRMNYDYKGKYLLEALFRYDGSYRYHPDQRWGFFPGVSAGWRISEEDFMRDVEWLSNLKLRGSYGILGTDAGIPFQYVTGFSLSGGGGYEFVDGTWTEGAAAPALTNKNLTWYKSKTINLGVDLGLLNNRIGFEFDVYQRNRSGLLSTRLVSLPNTFGGTLPEENLNSDRTQGFDFAISYNDNIGDFYFNVKGNFNLARTMNKYIERGPFAHSMDRWRNGLSNRWNDIVWGYQVEEQFSNKEDIIYAPIQCGVLGNSYLLPGDYRYKDVNGDGVIDGNDVMPIFYGGTPKMFYGLTLSGEWKGIDLNILIQGSGKYTVRFQGVYGEVLAYDLNTPAYFFDRWHKADPYNPDSEWIQGKYPSTRTITWAGSNYWENNIWRRDASYLRLKSIEIGYTIPRRFTNKIGIESLRIYSTGHNLLTITDPFVKAFDPEKIEGLNNEGFGYPLMRNFNLGININF